MEFHPDNFAVVRASAAEDAELSMREQKPVRKIAEWILDREDPSFECADVRYVGLLAGMVEQFAERTENSALNIAIDVPPEIAEGLIQERRAQGEVAQKLVPLIQSEAQWLELVDAEPLDLDNWAEAWDLEQ